MPYNIQEPGEPGRVDDPELVARRANYRTQMKQQFNKLYTDPYRHSTGHGGYPFDPLIQRYYAMKCAQGDYFKPNFYTARLYACIIIIPITAAFYWFHTGRAKIEHKYRTGQVAYKDRHPKLL